MTSAFAIQLKYEQHEVGPVHGPLAAFAEDAYRLARINPLAVADAVCGKASRVSGGVLVPDIALAEAGSHRLQAIFCGSDTLLGREYDGFGRLVGLRFPDGVRVGHHYDDRGRLNRVSSSGGVQFARRLDELGRMSSAQLLPGGRGFSFKRSPAGWLLEIGTPSGNIVWDASRAAPARVRADDGSELGWDRDNKGLPQCMRLKTPRGSFECGLVAETFEAVCNSGSEPGSTEILSPLGLLSLDQQQKVGFWLSATGEPTWFHHDSDNRIVQIWTSSGPTAIAYSDDGCFAVLNAAGRRLLQWPLPDDKGFLIIGPETVTIGKWRSNKRPASLLGMWGDSTVFSYGLMGRDRLPSSMESPQWGKVALTYTAGIALASVAVSGKGEVRLSYSSDGRLAQVGMDGSSPTAIVEVLHLAGFLFSTRSAGIPSFLGSLLWGGHI